MTSALSLQQRFTELDRLLTGLQRYWQLRTFELLQPPWQGQPLQAWLLSLSDQDRQNLLLDDSQRAEALTPFIPQAEQLFRLCQIDTVTGCEQPPLPARLSYHIPGRKWSQIQAFDQALTDSGLPFVEWCAGKGHLGRLLAFRHQRPVLSLELQPQLCEQGQRLANRLDLPCHHRVADVMTPSATQSLHPEQHAVALHACGKLHVQLLQSGVKQGVKAFSLSPCCYHLIDQPEPNPKHRHPHHDKSRYQALSQAAAASPLTLGRDDLSLAVQETVTAGARDQRLRQQQLCWRLGFDLLQRQVRDSNHYLNCPTIPQSRLSGSFSEFCHWMAARKQLNLPAGIDYADFEQRGEQRVIENQRIELVRQLFRRPLELWLVLDRALFLQEQGYQVELQQFCTRQLTPRNLLIQAQKRAI